MGICSRLGWRLVLGGGGVEGVFWVVLSAGIGGFSVIALGFFGWCVVRVQL